MLTIGITTQVVFTSMLVMSNIKEIKVGDYPYITDNDSYGYGCAIDNNGNEITDV